MSLSQSQWHDLSRLHGDTLKSSVFSVIQRLAAELQEKSSEDPAVLSAIPRLAELIESKPELNGYKEVFSTLARAVGLWNYIDKDAADPRDRLIAESVTLPELDGITLHREQILALNSLLNGRNLILSAPTSFGKSILIDALLASGKFRRIAIVLPTIALLDEFRRRFAARFSKRFQVVMYHSEEAREEDVIFLGTQERLIHRNDLGRLDLAVVDEFYKLDPSRQDDRSLTLNAAVYQLLSKANQFFFLGPNIESIRFSADSRWKFEFLKTRFSTVAVDTYDLRGVTDKFERLSAEIRNEDNWPALVFASAPDRANLLATALTEGHQSMGTGGEFAEWIDDNFGPNWELSSNVKGGIGVHHGRIPRAVASHFVRLFNSGDLPVLICTSTLIEGVNTAAKSVLIFDKAINKKPVDFFTFSNIKGRAGRLGQHHVGSVFLFHAPPLHQDIEINPPLFGDLDEAPDELIVHISEDDSTRTISDRVKVIGDALGLNSAQLRLASAVGLEDAESLKNVIEERKSTALLDWSGFPKYPNILAVCQIICEVRSPSAFGVRTPNQLAFMLNKLRAQQTMREFFHWYTASYSGEPKAQDNVFKFLRACEYGLPQLFSLIEILVVNNDARPNYSLFTAGMPRWFRPEILKNLDEQGIPIQISERFYHDGDMLETLAARLIECATGQSSALSSFERNWVLAALPAR